MLQDKVVLIAGAGPQMGSATALIAAREGASVALTARTLAAAEATAKTIVDAGGKAIALQCDLTSEEDVRATLAMINSDLGAIDAVFYNAAYYDNRQDSIDIDEEAWEMSMDVNLNGALRVARLTIPSMVERGGGSFVFNSSAASIVAGETRFGYQVSKAGLNAVTRFVAGKYGKKGIRANATLPFVLEGKIGEAAASLNCIGRSPTSEEIGEAVVFLLSDRAAIITGQIIHLDGGLFVRAPWPTPSARR
ncbi:MULTISPECIES: SDR family NAD(P)-dependent oxidoreductase [unclassified Frankia]|uniref:SDR family NAD(P)-dependent oxidoreductase n=1 Tax=unclassified Frankia TaxID=2632575 RepID=UPI00193198F9|nr:MULTISPECIES: SDR family oxidoreductase [unclassified Frankia]MBL7492303.1 SDR family oxidoreductase [Frankia sp. AgW1.1]